MDPTTQWLYSVTTGMYQYRDRSINDILMLIRAVPTLLLKTECLPNDPTMIPVVCLHGTLPIEFRGNVYNIPLKLWIHQRYPAIPPTVMVVPTASMVIRPSQHVDANGLFYHPFLSYWPSQPDRCSLIGLSQILRDVFSAEPPVYARSTTAPYAQSGPQGSPSPKEDERMTKEQEERVKHDSLMSAAKDALTRQMNLVNEHMTQEVDSLLVLNKQLNENSTFITTSMAKLEEELNKTITTRKEMQTHQHEMKIQIENFKNQIEPPVDDLVRPDSVLHQQLLMTVADIHALEDLIYFLAKAFNNDSLDLQAFLKNVRSMAKEAFLKKALMAKIRGKLNYQVVYE